MSIAFSRSLRALNNDRFRPSLLVLGATLCILTAWVVWFFFGSVPVYETSTQLQATPDGALAVTFSADALMNIAPNQNVTLQLNNGTTTKNYSGTIERVDVATGQAPGTARVFLDTPEKLPQSVQGQVRVETEKISPFAYALRAVQQPNLAPTAPTTTP